MINKMPDKAREYLQEIIDKHPGTSYATQAKEKLAEIEGGQ